MKNWLVVANSARARVLEETEITGRYVHVANLVHPESRMKASELEGDKPGHVVRTGHGLGSTNLQPHTPPRERERHQFAAEVATLLDDGVASGRCAGLTLVASNPFLGELKSCLDDKTSKCVLKTVASDYTALDDAALESRLHGGG